VAAGAAVARQRELSTPICMADHGIMQAVDETVLGIPEEEIETVMGQRRGRDHRQKGRLQ